MQLFSVLHYSNVDKKLFLLTQVTHMNIKELFTNKDEYISIVLFFSHFYINNFKNDFTFSLSSDLFLTAQTKNNKYFTSEIQATQALNLFDNGLLSLVSLPPLSKIEDRRTKFLLRELVFKPKSRKVLLRILEYSQTNKQFKDLEEIKSLPEELTDEH